jgi:hypothetical protein
VISCFLKLFVKSENVLCVVVIGDGHDDAVGKTNGLGEVLELFKRCLDMRGRLDENELTAWPAANSYIRVRCRTSNRESCCPTVFVRLQAAPPPGGDAVQRRVERQNGGGR